jgi:hypothetical protein
MSVWTAYPDGSQLTKVLDTNTPIPGWSGTFQEFYGDSVQIFNQTVVLIGFDCGGCTSGVGVYTVWASGGTVRKLVDKNTPVPGGAVNFGSFVTDFTTAPSGWSGIPFHQATGYVVFQNSQQVYAVPLFLGGNANDVAGNWDSSYSPPSPYCCIADSPSLNGGTVALRMGNVFGHASVQTVNRQGDPLSFRVIADRNTATPGGPAGYVFDDFTLGQAVNDKGIVFRGESNSPTAGDVVDGIYSYGSAGYAKLVDTNTPVPGGTGNFQSTNGFGRIAASNGVVVFQGLDAAGALGLYAVPEGGGTIVKVIAKGDPIGSGFTVDNVTMGKQAMSGSLLTFRVNYTNFQGAGMYSTTVVLP